LNEKTENRGRNCKAQKFDCIARPEAERGVSKRIYGCGVFLIVAANIG
jgi:hypothetical protein